MLHAQALTFSVTMRERVHLRSWEKSFIGAGPLPVKRGEVIKRSNLSVIDRHFNLQWMTITNRKLRKE